MTININEHDVYIYERNPARRGLDFTFTKDIKSDFLRYTIDYHCQNPIADIEKHPLPLLEERVDGFSLHLMAGLQNGRELRKDLDRTIKEAINTRQWFSSSKELFQQNLSVNHHLRVGGAMTPGRIQDLEGAKTIVVSYKTTTRSAATISIQLFKIVCFAYLKSRKLIVDTDATMGGKQDPNK